MKISLVRHGRPRIDLSERIKARDFSAWLVRYDEAALDGSLPPPRELIHAVSDCGCLLHSPTRRAVDSAGLLGLSVEPRVSPDAVEVPLPDRFFCPVALKPATLAVVARVWWTFGLATAAEGKRQAHSRARALAAQLEALAVESGHVVLVGHGYTNYLTYGALVRVGWKRVGPAGRGFWSHTQFTKPSAPQAPSRR